MFMFVCRIFYKNSNILYLTYDISNIFNMLDISLTWTFNKTLQISYKQHFKRIMVYALLEWTSKHKPWNRWQNINNQSMELMKSVSLEKWTLKMTKSISIWKTKVRNNEIELNETWK